MALMVCGRGHLHSTLWWLQYLPFCYSFSYVTAKRTPNLKMMQEKLSQKASRKDTILGWVRTFTPSLLNKREVLLLKVPLSPVGRVMSLLFGKFFHLVSSVQLYIHSISIHSGNSDRIFRSYENQLPLYASVSLKKSTLEQSNSYHTQYMRADTCQISWWGLSVSLRCWLVAFFALY